MARQIFAEFKKMLCIKGFYPLVMAYLASASISALSMRIIGIYSWPLLTYGFCDGYYLLGIALPIFICLYIHSDYKNGTIQNLYTVVKDRRLIVFVKAISIAAMLFILHLIGLAICRSLLLISGIKLQGGITFGSATQYFLYYVILLYIAMLCMTVSMLFRDTSFTCFLCVILVIPFGFLEKLLTGALPIAIRRIFLLSNIFKFGKFIDVSYKVLYLCVALLYIFILVFLSSLIARKESFH